MKSASAGLITLLNTTTEIYRVDLYTFTLVDGTILRYTSAESAIVANSFTFAAGPLFTRGSTRVVRGLQVDTLNVTVADDGSNLINGVPWIVAANIGVLDGADLLLESAFMSTWGDVSAGTLIQFGGRVAEITASRTEARLTIRSDLELLNIRMPRNLYQPGCLHTLYDAGCGVNKASKSTVGTITSTSTKQTLNCGLTQSAAYYDQGTVLFTSGPNNGVKRTIKSYTLGVVNLSYPLPYTPGISDTFSVAPGCDKQQATCASKFNNLANFRATPYIPVPETAL